MNAPTIIILERRTVPRPLLVGLDSCPDLSVDTVNLEFSAYSPSLPQTVGFPVESPDLDMFLGLAPVLPDLRRTVGLPDGILVQSIYKGLGLNTLSLCKTVGPFDIWIYHIIRPWIPSEPDGLSSGPRPSDRRSDLPPKTRRF